MITMTSVAKFSRAYSTPSPVAAKKPLAPDRVQFGIDIKGVSVSGSAAALDDLKKARGEAAKLRETLQKVLVSMQKMVKEADDEIKAATTLVGTAKQSHEKTVKGQKDLHDKFSRMNKEQQARNRKRYDQLRVEWEVAERKAKRLHEAAQERLKNAKAARAKLDGVKERMESVKDSIRTAHDLTTAIDAKQIRQIIGKIKSKHKIS